MAFDQELMILGLLKDGPKHGYEIKNKIKHIMEIFAGSNTQSFYYPLRIMENQGMVIRNAGRAGKRPQKYIYKLTPKGQARFFDLLNQSLVTIHRPRFNIDLSLYFLPYIKPDQIRHKLSVRLRMLNKIKSGLVFLKKSNKIKLEHHLAIINHNIELIKTEIKFISNFLIDHRRSSVN